ncbi:MAG: ATP-grasp domain-containing protein [Chloroflexi bacterium]|nr:ATP-grasp domain-containing protein [Chloroflexota bacterium]
MTNRILLLLTAHTYRAAPFLAAAERLGIEIATAVDLPPQLAAQWQVTLGLDYRDPDTAVAAITAYAQNHPLAAILAVDDSGTLLAARAAAALGLPHNYPAAALAARNKLVMRQMLHIGGVPVPTFHAFTLADDPAHIAAQVSFPCVVKPLELSGSRGVMRANNAQELAAAIERLRRILLRLNPQPDQPFLVEDYIPGVEVALEGMMDNGELHPLALFDKPDPLEGPFFEETLYITPSRLPTAVQQAIFARTAQAAAALGLRTGPIHAELRVNDDGAWLVEMAGRSIGGLCSRTLRFGVDASLEELILRQAAGLGLANTVRQETASGVMMIPIPEAGLLRAVTGEEAATAVPLIESVEITAPLHNPLVPLPEGESYLGFIFARGESATAVEAALRVAHQQLHFTISPMLPINS